MRSTVVSLAFAMTVGLAGPAWAQSRPLTTQDPETVPSGNILLETGVNYEQGVTYPASGLRGNQWKIVTFGLSFGVSPIAEIQFDGGIRNHLSVKTVNPAAPLLNMVSPVLLPGSGTGDVEDAVIGAKVRFVRETDKHPALALRFSTRLPNASNESGLGLDTTDFNFDLMAGKTIQSVRFVGNLGLGILGDPTRGDRQNDVINFGMSAARAIRTGFEVVGEINGRLSTRAGTPPPGTESRARMLLGTRLTRGPVRFDTAIYVGITDVDPTWGFTFGGTWVFKAFEVK